jgi:hypothetical protein
MLTSDLQDVVHAVIRRAQRQGSIRPRDIRDELTQQHQSAAQWKEVVALSGSHLRRRDGLYYYRATVSAPVRQEKRQRREISLVVRRLIRQYKKQSAQIERRQQGRINFVQPVRLRLEDGRELTLLSREISPTGIRLIGTQSLLGQRVEVQVPGEDGASVRFLVRILWTCTVGDGLFENGGTFLETLEG